MTLTKYSISAAHRITGKSRTTLAKHIKSGKLSVEEDADGNKLIDASELMRVYGDECDFSREEGAEQADSAPRGDVPRGVQGVQPDLNTLQVQLDKEVEERQREREQLQQQIEHLQDALKLAQEGQNRVTLLLENQSGAGEWRKAIAELETRLTSREDSARREAKAEARREFLSKPWWKLVWE